MEKRLYDLDENGPFSKIMPPLTTIEEMLLRESLEKEGCYEPLDVWDGVIVDGHNRCRICKELDIPFAIHEMTFESEAEATVWLIKKQLGRRNLPVFAKIEKILPFEPMLREQAERRMYSGKKIENPDPRDNCPQGSSGRTRDAVAAIIGISGKTYERAKWILEYADEATLELLRKDAISINKAREMTRWHLEVADDFTKYRIMKGVITLEQAYDEYKKREKEELEQLRAQAEHDNLAEGEEMIEDDEIESDPTYDGKIVPLFPSRKPIIPSAGQNGPLVAGGYIGSFTQQPSPKKEPGKIVSIIPYLKTRGWNPEEAMNDDQEEPVSEEGDESTDKPKAEIISIIPYLKARGRLPMDYEEPRDVYDDGDCAEEYADDDGEDEAYEPVIPTRRVVNIDDIKLCDPSKPLPAMGVSLMGIIDNDDGGGSSDDEGDDDADQACHCDDISNSNILRLLDDDSQTQIRNGEGWEKTVSFEEIRDAMRRVVRNFQDDVTVLLSAIKPEDRTEENGTQVTTILNDCMTAVIDKYTEVF